jgi:DNA-binding LytR/AlgR family response regulator
VAFWIVLMTLQAVFSTMVAIVDVRTRAVPRANWEVATWEGSSHLVLLLLVPALVAVERRLSPLVRTHVLRFVAWHAVASVVFSVIHVVGMFGLRALVYAMAGERYDFGGWVSQWGYEYLKDVRVYASIVFGIWAYRLFMLRLQGEARVLDAPEAPAEPEPVEPETPQPARPERFLVRKLRREFLIAATDIDWLQAEGNYVGLHVNGHDYLLRATLTDFLTQLDPARFVRVHRSHAVNLGRIKEIEPLDGGDARLHMHDGTTVPCSRRYRDALRAGAG